MLALLIPIILILLMVTVILGWSMLFGWLLSMIVALSFFEGSLLVMLATFAAGYMIFRFQTDVTSSAWLEEDDDFYQIAPDRFVSSSAERTWENWLRYELANAVNAQFREAGMGGETLSEQDLREIAVRIADVAVAAVRRRSPRTHPLRLTDEQLKAQMRRMELQPYDDDILAEAATGINLMLSTPMVTRVVREQLWDDRTPFDFTT